MSREYKFPQSQAAFGGGRPSQFGLMNGFEQYFSEKTLQYLDEKIINHLLDQMVLREFFGQFKKRFNDYSFLIAPAYKALEGYLFQLAKDLELPSSGNSANVGGYYFDEEKIDAHIDALLNEISAKTDVADRLTDYEKQDIKSRIKEMKDFLRHYRHSPAHFMGEPIDTMEKAERTVMQIFGALDNTTAILMKAGLVKIP